MAVVAAGMHDSAVLRLVLAVALFLDAQRVHVRPQRD